jgi:hypothetical protein
MFQKFDSYLPKFLFTGINGNVRGEKEIGGGKRNFL